MATGGGDQSGEDELQLLITDLLFPPTRTCLPDWRGSEGVQREEGAESIYFGKISSISGMVVKKFRRESSPI